MPTAPTKPVTVELPVNRMRAVLAASVVIAPPGSLPVLMSWLPTVSRPGPCVSTPLATPTGLTTPGSTTTSRATVIGSHASMVVPRRGISRFFFTGNVLQGGRTKLAAVPGPLGQQVLETLVSPRLAYHPGGKRVEPRTRHLSPPNRRCSRADGFLHDRMGLACPTDAVARVLRWLVRARMPGRAGHDAKNARVCPGAFIAIMGEMCGCNGWQYARDAVMRACTGNIAPPFVFRTQRHRALWATAEAVQESLPEPAEGRTADADTVHGSAGLARTLSGNVFASAVSTGRHRERCKPQCT